MKRILFLIILSLSLVAAFSQEHLKPAKDFSSEEAILRDYYEDIFTLLTEGLSEPPIARYTVLPSFFPEYVLSLEKSDDGSCFLLLRECSENYWYAEDKGRVKVEDSYVPISEDLAIAMQELFRTVTGQIREPENEIPGLDGVFYYFSFTGNDGQILTGQIWSPRKTSPMAALVSVSEELVDLAAGRKQETEKLVKRIDELAGKLREAND